MESAKDYIELVEEATETALHLYSTRANATQIQQSLADYAAGNIQTGELCD